MSTDDRCQSRRTAIDALHNDHARALRIEHDTLLEYVLLVDGEYIAVAKRVNSLTLWHSPRIALEEHELRSRIESKPVRIVPYSRVPVKLRELALDEDE